MDLSAPPPRPSLNQGVSTTDWVVPFPRRSSSQSLSSPRYTPVSRVDPLPPGTGPSVAVHRVSSSPRPDVARDRSDYTGSDTERHGAATVGTQEDERLVALFLGLLSETRRRSSRPVPARRWEARISRSRPQSRRRTTTGPDGDGPEVVVGSGGEGRSTGPCVQDFGGHQGRPRQDGTTSSPRSGATKPSSR